MAWNKTPDTAFTPIATFEDLTALNSLPSVKLEADARLETGRGGDQVHVTIKNPGKDLAFMVHAGVHKAHSEDEVLPVLWDDNYVSLLPGQSKQLTAWYLPGGALGPVPLLRIDGWNVRPIEVAVGAGQRKKH